MPAATEAAEARDRGTSPALETGTEEVPQWTAAGQEGQEAASTSVSRGTMRRADFQGTLRAPFRPPRPAGGLSIAGNEQADLRLLRAGSGMQARQKLSQQQDSR